MKRFLYVKQYCLKWNCFDIQLHVNKNYTYTNLIREKLATDLSMVEYTSIPIENMI